MTDVQKHYLRWARWVLLALMGLASVGQSGGWARAQSQAPAVQFAQPQSWTRYRIDASNNALIAGTTGPAVSWRSPTIQDQIFAVSVVGDRVYAVGTGATPGVYALNRSNGQLVWGRKLANQVMTQPLVVGGRLFIGMGTNGQFMMGQQRMFGLGSNSLLALSASTGAVLWRVQLRGEAMPTPLYENGTLYWVTGDRQFLAVSATTGQILWHLTMPSFMSMSSPVQYGDLLIFGGAYPDAAYAVNIRTHRIQWQYRWGTWQGLPITNGIDDCPPALAGNVVFCSGSASVDPTRPTGGVIHQFAYALDARTGHLLWQVDQGLGHRTSFFAAGVPAAINHTVYVESPGNGGLWALDATTGRTLWKATLGSSDRSAPIIDGSSLFIIDDMGTFYQFDARTGRLLHRMTLGGQVSNAGMVLVNGTFYIPNLLGGVVDAIPEKTIMSSSSATVVPPFGPVIAQAGAVAACGG